MDEAERQTAESTEGVPKSKVGSIASLWRYPVKSMTGEELDTADVTDRGLLGDRAYALMDSNGKVASAKSPRKWARLLGFWAALMEPPHDGEKIPRYESPSRMGSRLAASRATSTGFFRV